MVSDLSESDGPAARYLFFGGLLLADWEQPESPLRLRTDLTLAEVEHASQFQNARILLRMLAEGGGAPATAAGNLNREFAGRMLEAMVMPGLSRESTRRFNKVINEADVRDLQLLREVCQFGGLIARRKKHFRVTARGRELLADEEAGSLYRHLFLTFFRKMDLRSLFPFRDVPGIQATLGVILWRLDSIGQTWTTVRGLAEMVLLPPVLDELRATMVSEFETEEWILAGYVLEPLLDFGLIEREKGSQWPGVGEKDVIRLTPLWRRFLQFAPAA
ncbi:MAG: hypothetical protein H0W20_11790 [Chthoniobacterales bacterium]|nr:hypothetical protein [Chthoniobacterales bacterium]